MKDQLLDNIRNFTPFTPVMLRNLSINVSDNIAFNEAINHDNYGAFDILYEYNGNNFNGCTSLEYCYKNNKVNILQWFMDHELYGDNVKPLFLDAVQKCNTDMVHILISGYRNIDSCELRESFLTAARTNFNIFKLIYDTVPIFVVDLLDDAFKLACSADQEDTMIWILEKREKKLDIWDLMVQSCQKGYVKMIKILLQDVILIDQQIQLLISIASQSGRLNILRWFNNVSPFCDQLKQEIFLTACTHGYVDIIAFIFNLTGSITDAVDNNNNTGFQLACFNNKLEVVKWFGNAGFVYTLPLRVIDKLTVDLYAQKNDTVLNTLKQYHKRFTDTYRNLSKHELNLEINFKPENSLITIRHNAGECEYSRDKLVELCGSDLYRGINEDGNRYMILQMYCKEHMDKIIRNIYEHNGRYKVECSSEGILKYEISVTEYSLNVSFIGIKKRNL